MSQILRYVLYVIMIYIACDLLAQLLFNVLAYFPPSRAGYQKNSSIISIKIDRENTIAATSLTTPNAKYTILYSHGNATDIVNLMPILKQYQDHGYNIFAYDYPGYGLSTGKPSENGTYVAALESYNYLINILHIAPDRIILWGQSLGAAMAIELATKVPCAGLVIESPFLSAFRTYTQIKLLAFDRYNNLDKITSIHCPLFVIHGEADTTIPMRQGITLYKKATVPKQYYIVPDANHNDVIQIGGNHFWERTADFINMIESVKTNSKP